MSIYCMNDRGEEDFAICEENGTLKREKDLTTGGKAYVYGCEVCDREWQEIYSYEGKFDMEGNPL